MVLHRPMETAAVSGHVRCHSKCVVGSQAARKIWEQNRNNLLRPLNLSDTDFRQTDVFDFSFCSQTLRCSNLPVPGGFFNTIFVMLCRLGMAVPQEPSWSQR